MFANIYKAVDKCGLLFLTSVWPVVSHKCVWPLQLYTYVQLTTGCKAYMLLLDVGMTGTFLTVVYMSQAHTQKAIVAILTVF